MCSLSEDAIAAQIELAQRYRDGYQPKRVTIYYSESGIPIAIGPPIYPCGRPEPEKEITPNQSMADYWTKFTSVTKVMLLAKNGDADAQIELHRLYLGKGDEHDMINLFRDNFIIGIIENDKDIGIWWEPPNIIIKPPYEFVLDTTF
ncbi:MAG: hypothetical protein NZ824_04665 [Candidatus Thioglobus sp.]|nr:hypothetical protein [Candidatus Thioglobus sp.]